MGTSCPTADHGDAGSVGGVKPERPEDYVSTACRLGDHERCRRRPIVRCACWCHPDADPVVMLAKPRHYRITWSWSALPREVQSAVFDTYVAAHRTLAELHRSGLVAVIEFERRDGPR